jgi:hypothetical protein
MTHMGLAFGFCLASLFCTLIVSQLGWFVKRVWKLFFKSLSFRSLAIFEVACTLTSPLDMINNTTSFDELQ